MPFSARLRNLQASVNRTGWLPKYLVMTMMKAAILQVHYRCMRSIIPGANMYLTGHGPMHGSNAGWLIIRSLLSQYLFLQLAVNAFLLRMNMTRKKQLMICKDAAVDYAKEASYSSLHYLFPTSDECSYLQQQGLLIRHDVQFHWENRDYQSFQAFLSTMSSRKRKKIARERRRVSEHGQSSSRSSVVRIYLPLTCKTCMSFIFQP